MTRREFGIAALAPVQEPWYRRTYRWGQTNITEKDPDRYDIAWWREQWKRTCVQGVIINAGGIVAYYPSKFPLHHRAEFLKDRDLYGELTKAAHADGLVVLARMDSNRTAEDFHQAHPDWFCVDQDGKPYRAADKYITCVNSAYYDEYLPEVLREIIERSHPEGFTDNSWSGMGRESICYCANCAKRFGKALPRRADWDTPVYREWIMWNYRRRIEIWELNNRVTSAAGGADCVWIGMNSGSIAGQARTFRDMKEICERAPMMLMDHQRRDDATGFQQNGETGKLVHGLLGWDKVVPESMAMYQAGRVSFRLASKPAAEARMWMIAGFAGGIQPWWHHIGAWHEDRRMHKTAEPVMRWHKANEEYLANRKPVAAVGLVWSQRNTDFFGRNNAEDVTEAPYRGMAQALIRARIPYVPVHADLIDRESSGLAALILPSLGAMSDSQCAAVWKFVERGGRIVATGATSLFNEWGERRPDFALATLFGAHATEAFGKNTRESVHSYLRLESKDRTGILAGFADTDILPFGGAIEGIHASGSVPLTYIPPFPIYPPETSWMRAPKTDIPALVINGRSAYLPADVDRRYARENLPDHGNLLANLARWAVAENMPLKVEGPGLIDCHLYQQAGRLVLHLVNLTNPAAWRAPMEELIPLGPVKISVKLPKEVGGRKLKLLVSGATVPSAVRSGWITFELRSILDHEVAVIS